MIHLIVKDDITGAEIGQDEDGWFWYRKPGEEWELAEYVSWSESLDKPVVVVAW